MAKKLSKPQKKIRVRQIRSIIGGTKKQRAILESLGLRGIRSEVVHSANPAIRGMIDKIPHLLEVTEE